MVDLEKLPDLNKEEYKPLWIQLSDVLADYIQSNSLKPGHPLPSEKELIQRYHVSRMTVRLAIQRLEREELVHKVQGKGTFVAALKPREYIRGFQNLEETLAEQSRHIDKLFGTQQSQQLDVIIFDSGSPVLNSGITHPKRFNTLRIRFRNFCT